MSMRFNTFILDSEYERVQHGWLKGGSHGSDGTKPNLNTGNTGRRFGSNPKKTTREDQLAAEQAQQRKSKGVSFWEYFDVQCSKYTLFHSFSYHPTLHKV